MRVSIRSVPNIQQQCRIATRCVYRDTDKICSEPRTNKGNSDAACHKMLNRYVMTMLTPNAQIEGLRAFAQSSSNAGLGDFCLFCGNEVSQDKWRQHMIEVHKAVLKESPKYTSGLWRLPGRNVVVAA